MTLILSFRRTMANAKGGAMDKLNEDLQDVTRIMTKNMEDLLWRGDSLDRTSMLQRHKHPP